MKKSETKNVICILWVDKWARKEVHFKCEKEYNSRFLECDYLYKKSRKKITPFRKEVSPMGNEESVEVAERTYGARGSVIV